MYDKEDLLFDIVSVFQNNLNTRISAINTEKNDNLTLETLSSGAYFVQEAGETSLNFSPYLFFYLSLPETESIESSSVDKFSVMVLIVFQDEANSNFELIRKLLRYQRAMKETVENNFSITAGSNRIKVAGVEPVIIRDQDSSRLIKTCGIEIETYIN